ncbi:MAG TPA: hypothetical protein VGL86_02040 [Polyangia bacterium]|jgi:hypothetical protein
MMRKHTGGQAFVVTVDGKRRFTSLSALVAEHDVPDAARAAILKLQPGETVTLHDTDGGEHVVERIGGRTGQAGASSRHRGPHRHRFASPHEHGAAVAELQSEYDQAKRRYRTLGDQLFAAKSSAKR